MKAILNAAKQNLLYYRLAYLYAVLFSINALACAIVASFMNVEWGDLSVTSKFILVVVVLQNWSGVMLAFMNKTMGRLQGNEPLIQNGDVPGASPPAK